MDLRRLLQSQPVLLGFGFLLLIAVAIGTVWLVKTSQAANAAVVKTLDVENKLSFLLLHIRRAESAQRGYILTGDPLYEQDYREAATAIPASLAELKTMTSENPVQSRMLDQFEPALRQRLQDLEDVLRHVRSSGEDEARGLIRSGAGRRHMQEIRAFAEAMIEEERRLLASRTAQADRLGRDLLLATISGSGLIFVLAGFSVLSVRRSNRQRDEALHSLEATNANLESAVAERTADLREANEEIQRFAYIVSHDLRSPLVNIMGFTSEIEALREEIFAKLRELRQRVADAEAADSGKDEALDRDFEEALGFIKSSIAQMDRLIGAILRLSREGRRAFTPEPVDVRRLLETVRATLAHQLGEAKATISIGALPTVTSDRLALEQVFSNLLDNAVKYLKPGEPGRIDVQGRATPTQVVYEISDNGRGIDPKDHARIFDLFRRAGEQDRPGEGIGLAHVRALVRRLGGAMTVRSELGKGSVFTVALPARWAARTENIAA